MGCKEQEGWMVRIRTDRSMMRGDRGAETNECSLLPSGEACQNSFNGYFTKKQ